MVDEFLGISIVGAALSLGIEWLQGKYGATSKEARGLAIGGSLVLGTLVWAIAQTPYYQSVLGVLAAASTVYALFFSKKKK